MRTSVATRVAAVLLGLEAAGLLAVVAWQIAALSGGDTDSVSSALALLVLTALGAVLLGAFSAAVWRGRSWGRSGGIVAQLLILAVALGAATGAYAEPMTALAIAAPAVLTLILLVLAARRQHPSGDGRQPDS
ncbi:histidine kinase [Microbacterium sp. BK668]|uniref:histidine kinase n=1 Tax=Microbacterium sp. BK668 TaxID=2512118 RepID=UPI00105D80A1|nr:histidine kinase [Microbacterium sp. BK668]TDN88440.1 hypothetical protein EV279_2882 [Microbacterium sp. BK668]